MRHVDSRRSVFLQTALPVQPGRREVCGIGMPLGFKQPGAAFCAHGMAALALRCGYNLRVYPALTQKSIHNRIAPSL